MRDPSLLLKCEEFLLHPTVRALSLAQRVDFLEKKGLTPAEITQCLTSLKQRNGLSQLVGHPISDLAAFARARCSKTSRGSANSPRELLQFVLQKYGMVSLCMALLGFTYVQLKSRKTEQLFLQHKAEKTERQKRQHARVAALLAVVKDQQTQYKQAAELLRTRATRLFEAAVKEEEEKAADDAVTIDFAATSSTKLSAMQSTRQSEVEALKTEVMELKSAVVDAYLQSPIATKIEVVKERPLLQRPLEATKANRLEGKSVVRNAVFTERITSLSSGNGASHLKAKEARLMLPVWYESEDKKQSGIKDQTAMSFGEITEMFEQGQAQEQLSTAGRYRLLFTM
uniref:Peroxisome membrane anchor protein Pex14p N-terminal domain-containing protein n=1 Tax=Peronospora matthiolae TaxID=2874970 RepID=A0AAV1TT97_9STRA